MFKDKEGEHQYTCHTYKSDKEQDQIWWLTELRKCFEAEGYNAYAISTEQESVLYDLEYIPLLLMKI